MDFPNLYLTSEDLGPDLYLYFELGLVNMHVHIIPYPSGVIKVAHYTSSFNHHHLSKIQIFQLQIT